MKKLAVCLLALALLAGCAAKTTGAESVAAPASSAAASYSASSALVSSSAPAESPAADEFVFTRENFPVLDGSTSLVPLGQAVAAALLGEGRDEVSDLISFHRTTDSFRYLMRGESDLLLVAEPNQSVLDELAAAGFAYRMDPVALDGLVFMVNADNPVESLTPDQLRGIYTGEITNWSQVGGEDADIVAFQRNETSGSQVLMQKLVMKDAQMAPAPQEMIPGEMDTLMTAVKGYADSANAIGYSVYYYANDMRMADGLKILKVDGIEPTDETIGDGSYPFVNPYFVVIADSTAADSPTQILHDWLLSDAGQTLLTGEGYVGAGGAK